MMINMVEAAQIANVSVPTVRYWIQRGFIEAHRPDGWHVQIDEEAFRDYVNERLVKRKVVTVDQLTHVYTKIGELTADHEYRKDQSDFYLGILGQAIEHIQMLEERFVPPGTEAPVWPHLVEENKPEAIEMANTYWAEDSNPS